MRNINEEYRILTSEILNSGIPKDDRTGVGTLSKFGYTLVHDMELGFPLLHIKKVSFKAAKVELMWILQGRTDLKYLEYNAVRYWRPDYERSGRTDGTLGPVYGKQWRDFSGIDQLLQLVHSINLNPHSRRHMVISWAPHELDDMVLPPCHYAFQVYVNNGRIDLLWQQRSADVFLGLPYDIVMYGLLLELLAKCAGLKPGQLIGQLGDCHLYNNHLDQAKQYIKRPIRVLPTLEIDKTISIQSAITMDDRANKRHGLELSLPEMKDIRLKGYNPYPNIPAPLSVGK